MKAIVLGSRGMLGTDLVAELSARGHEVTGLDREEIDVTDPTDMARLASGGFGEARWILNCAAYTAVDKAESEVREATELNTLAPGYIGSAAQGLGARLIHISTDFVFDGTATEPYEEDAVTHPLGVYGTTKRDGEEAALRSGALVVRTAWLYGPNGNSFPRTMTRAHLAGKRLRVVADQVGCPTYTADLARVLVDLIERDADSGIYHAVGVEAMTWHDFAWRTLQAWRRRRGGPGSEPIEPIRAADWPTPAVRPAYSVLAMTKIVSVGIAPMRTVDDALDEFCRRLEQP